MKYLRIATLVLVGVACAGCYSARVAHSDAAVMSLDQAKQDMVTRWNETVANNPSNFASSGFSFIWPTFEQFPHPTFRGGSAEAYQEFARLLLIYTQTGDNFDFLAVNGLFDVELRDASVSGSADFGTLRGLVNQFASDSFASNFSFSAQTVADLRQLQARVAAAG
jgi:hypothetical protein